jgi:hypothetical protein
MITGDPVDFWTYGDGTFNSSGLGAGRRIIGIADITDIATLTSFFLCFLGLR